MRESVDQSSAEAAERDEGLEGPEVFEGLEGFEGFEGFEGPEEIVAGAFAPTEGGARFELVSIQGDATAGSNGASNGAIAAHPMSIEAANAQTTRGASGVEPRWMHRK